ncbi:hypothetical protein CYMTET_28209, partial [Cymbomonas tetramitiformis]
HSGFIEIKPADGVFSQRVLWLSFWAEVHYNSIYPESEKPMDKQTRLCTSIAPGPSLRPRTDDDTKESGNSLDRVGSVVVTDWSHPDVTSDKALSPP